MVDHDRPYCVEEFPDGTRRITTAVYWRHQLGGEAHCLARFYSLPEGKRPVVILSEIRSNPYEYPLGLDFSAAARALLNILRKLGETVPDAAIWVLHHGRFSYYDSLGVEDYGVFDLRGEDGGNLDELANYRRLSSREAQDLLADIPKSSVEDDVVKAGLERIVYW
ncbi:hypothetical protein [Nocardiopsis rhodophaea]